MKKIILTSLTSAVLASTILANVNYGSVNGEAITNADIKMIIRDPKVQYESLPKDVQERVLNQVVDTKLLAQNAIKSGVTNDPAFKDALNKLKNDLALEFWMQKQSQKIKVTEEDLKAFYEKNKDKFTQKAVLKARHILVNDKKIAQDIIKTLNNSKNLKADFIKLAKEKSTGPSGINGGDLGWFEPKQMVPEFSSAAQKLKKDSITTEPIKTQFGYHIIYLEDKKDEGIANYENAKPKIHQVVGQEKFLNSVKDTVKKLKTTAKIKLNK
jgi:parvulin-like peptidyl-prolyl isomerase